MRSVLDIFKGKKLKPAKGKISMSKKSFKEEHSKLVKVLKSGTKSERQEEARKQHKELKEKM